VRVTRVTTTTEEQERPAWLSPDLRVAQAARVYAPLGDVSFERLGRFYLAQRTDGQFALVDPARPWNDATVSVHRTRSDAERLIPGVHPGHTWSE
jgi:hypothetical protein